MHNANNKPKMWPSIENENRLTLVWFSCEKKIVTDASLDVDLPFKIHLSLLTKDTEGLNFDG